MKKSSRFYIFSLIFIIILGISYQRHQPVSRFHYQAEIFSDKAGYHVFLPALFYYNFDGDRMPEGIDSMTGMGFTIEGDKIITKYPIGVAVMHTPFFVGGMIIDKFKAERHLLGYTNVQHFALDISTAFYVSLGFLLLYIAFVYWLGYSKWKTTIALASLFFCSNMLYYSTRDSGMSHAYSFALFSAIVYAAVALYKTKNHNYLFWMGTAFVLAFFIRPVNVVFLIFPLVFFLFYFRLYKEAFTKKGIVNLLKVVPLFVALLGLQLGYNYYAFNELTLDGYKTESFTNLTNMDFSLMFISPDNGLLIYSPIYLMIFLSLFYLYRVSKRSAILFTLYFAVICLTYAAWNAPGLGCGFGHRGFMEHMAFFSFPFVIYLNKWKQKQLILFATICLLVAVLLFIAQYNFDGCWHGKTHYDWDYFFDLFKKKQYL